MRKSGAPTVVRRVRWAGAQGFDAFELRLASSCSTHHIVIPRVCCNLALVDSTPIALPAAPELSVRQQSACSGGEVEVTARSGDADGRLELTLTHPDGRSEVLATRTHGRNEAWSGTLRTAGSYRVTAVTIAECGPSETVMREFQVGDCAPTCALASTPPADPKAKAGRSTATIDMCGSSAATGSLMRRTATISCDGSAIDTIDLSDACRNEWTIPEYGDYTVEGSVEDDRGVASSNACQASFFFAEPPASRVLPFIAAPLVGIERRWRFEGEPDHTAGLIGAAGGVMFPVGEERRCAFLVQAGGFLNLRKSGESTLFADVGGDLSFGRGFVGAGVGVWDFNHSDTTEATIFLNAGLDTNWKVGENPVQWFVEGRLFPAMLDMTDDNYVVFTGLRLVFEE